MKFTRTAALLALSGLMSMPLSGIAQETAAHRRHRIAVAQQTAADHQHHTGLKVVGGSAAGGAVVGGLMGGGKGAVIGGLVGAGGGAVANHVRKNHAVAKRERNTPR